MPAHIVSSIQAPDFGAMTLRIGDLNGDGAPDLLFVQSDYGTRSISCLTATTILGRQLWQSGGAAPHNGRVYSDLPVQVYDWDNDGRNEVLYVRQAHYADPMECHVGDCRIRERARRYEGQAAMVVLDSLTGRKKTSLPLPPAADDSFLLADLTGRGRREDLLVKDRYWNLWGISHSGEVLWHWAGATGHYPAVADVDGDGRDEVFLGYALLDHDGRAIFDHASGLDPCETHSDANAIARLPDGQWRLLYGNHGAHCLQPDGREIWHKPMNEAQHVVVGRFLAATPLQVAVVNRGQPRNEQGAAVLYLFDLETGRELWRREQPHGGWAANCLPVLWTGQNGLLDLLVAGRGPRRPAVIYDGEGKIVDELEVPAAYCDTYDSGRLGGVNAGIHYCYRADLFGDSRDEVIVAGAKGACIYANSGPLAIPTLYNATIYRGM